MMSRIRGKNTTPERLLRTALWDRGVRYRLHYRTPTGRPDVVVPGRRVAVFIDGCFWHGCPAHYVRPRSREDFWALKLRENVGRDRRQTRALESSGWVVVRVWEHEVFETLEKVVGRIEKAVRGDSVRRVRHPMVIQVDPKDATGSEERRTLVDLRDDDWQRVVEQKRHTRKWKRPKAE